MSSRSRLAASLLVVAALGACDREARQMRASPLPEGEPQSRTSELVPGGTPAPQVPDPRSRLYEGNAYQVSEGGRYYRWFNCNGCHSNGGGGMGPALIDDEWRYGGSMEQIVSTILDGRPNGMPSFRGKIPEQQVWQIAAYVRSLNGQNPVAASSRRDAMASVPPRNQATPQPQRSEYAPPPEGTR
jgi:cytochrome c oxidase cbb3-type subunit 3